MNSLLCGVTVAFLGLRDVLDCCFMIVAAIMLYGWLIARIRLRRMTARLRELREEVHSVAYRAAYWAESVGDMMFGMERELEALRGRLKVAEQKARIK